LGILGRQFGYTTNDKGFKVLDSHVRIIQGDGVNYDSIDRILSQMQIYGWSTDNIAFGMGGALLQNLNRDTQSYAFKCSSTTVNGVEHAVYKQPVTDTGKVSKKGRLQLFKCSDKYITANPEEADGLLYKDELVEVFRNGEIIKFYTFEEVRKNAS
jgi:nicotinamide phosphoribosyltransferase